jgi:hypothetical protein
MSCAYYTTLRAKWYDLANAAKIEDQHQPARIAAADRQLQSLRAHREICAQCADDFRSAFPEIHGRPFVSQEIIEVDKL